MIIIRKCINYLSGEYKIKIKKGGDSTLIICRKNASILFTRGPEITVRGLSVGVGYPREGRLLVCLFGCTIKPLTLIQVSL